MITAFGYERVVELLRSEQREWTIREVADEFGVSYSDAWHWVAGAYGLRLIERRETPRGSGRFGYFVVPARVPA